MRFLVVTRKLNVDGASSNPYWHRAEAACKEEGKATGGRLGLEALGRRARFLENQGKGAPLAVSVAGNTHVPGEYFALRLPPNQRDLDSPEVGSHSSRIRQDEVLKEAEKENASFLGSGRGKSAVGIMGVEDYLKNVIKKNDLLVEIHPRAQ